ncbi:hypothetical protein EDEG_00224 [Edhazardia aedis USNM 41457]|uniref:Uncharacterized protein n=1 Tax=Edhazardia aedis (strain USNM 41457) TaxID=1003232 RepID=J9DL42_EDHAE|nr:hypothetical protein EDEG_00224 [Edhazardia aedis USNM 41457]|eukprot:EJW03315.1 hypothetical protein EDEG_00224 [Edhazardia aedis USNM 41457]
MHKINGLVDTIFSEYRIDLLNELKYNKEFLHKYKNTTSTKHLYPHIDIKEIIVPKYTKISEYVFYNHTNYNTLGNSSDILEYIPYVHGCNELRLENYKNTKLLDPSFCLEIEIVKRLRRNLEKYVSREEIRDYLREINEFCNDVETDIETIFFTNLFNYIEARKNMDEYIDDKQSTNWCNICFIFSCRQHRYNHCYVRLKNRMRDIFKK